MTTDHRFADFLADSFATLQRELPDVHAEMCRRLSRRSVTIRVGRECVRLKFGDAKVSTALRSDPPAVTVRTTRSAILALIDGEATLLDAALQESLVLRGSPDDLARFHDGLMAYLHGAVRAPSFPPLLRRFRQPATRGRARRRDGRTH